MFVTRRDTDTNTVMPQPESDFLPTEKIFNCCNRQQIQTKLIYCRLAPFDNILQRMHKRRSVHILNTCIINLQNVLVHSVLITTVFTFDIQYFSHSKRTGDWIICKYHIISYNMICIFDFFCFTAHKGGMTEWLGSPDCDWKGEKSWVRIPVSLKVMDSDGICKYLSCFKFHPI